MTTRTYLTISIIFPLIIGFAIYSLFRTEEIVFYSWVKYFGFNGYIQFNNSNNYQISTHVQVPEWIRFSIPDGLWTYAFTSTIISLWSHKLNYFWLVAPLFVGVILEILQFYNLIPGTFDLIDLICILLGYSLALILGMRWARKCTET